ncbi:MAG: hypothetical protein ACT4OM_05030 [Actinomycetota bacterium]
MTRVAVLGSSGSAAHLAALLAEDPRVAEVVRGEPADPARAVLSSDVIIGARAPDPDTERTAAAAAVAAGVPYISTSASPEIYNVLAGLHGEAVRRGSLVLTGMSWSPGLSNLMAMHAVGTLDNTRGLRIAWAASSAGQTAEAALSRAAAAFSGEAPIIDGGKLRPEAAGGHQELIFMPQPVGWVRLALARSSEPLTVPRAVDGLSEMTVLGGLVEPLANCLATMVGRTPLAASWCQGLISITGRLRPPRPWSALRVDATGKKDGKMKAVSLGLVDQLSNLLTAPAVVAALTLAEMPNRKGGVLAPEDVFDPTNFFRRLAHQGVRLAVLERPR